MAEAASSVPGQLEAERLSLLQVPVL